MMNTSLVETKALELAEDYIRFYLDLTGEKVVSVKISANFVTGEFTNVCTHIVTDKRDEYISGHAENALQIFRGVDAFCAWCLKPQHIDKDIATMCSIRKEYNSVELECLQTEQKLDEETIFPRDFLEEEMLKQGMSKAVLNRRYGKVVK